MFKRLTLAATLCSSLSLAGLAQAEYTDAIHLPALKKDSASYSLLLDITQAGQQLVAVGERGHILRSQDLGKNWVQADVPTRMQLNAVQFVSEQLGFAVGEDEVILKTSDAGNTWSLQHDGLDADMFGPLLDVQFIDDQRGFAVGVFNKLFYTEDGGESWQNWQEHIDNLDEWHLIALATTGEHHNTIYITSEQGLLFRSTDGGESFTPLQTDHDGSFHGILAREAADGTDQLLLWGVGGILYSTSDGGESWTQIETGTDNGIAGGTWLQDGSALLVGANGTLIRVDPSLQQASNASTESGLPLSSVVQLSQEQAMAVGFGGSHALSLSPEQH